MSSLLITPRGTPTPPQDIERRLRAINDRLSLSYFDNGGGAWAVMLQWSDIDRRRETVRDGRTDEKDARDVICWLPVDCSVESAHDYFVKACLTGYIGSNKDEVRSMLNQVHAWNDAQAQRNAQETSDYAAEIAPMYADEIAAEVGVKANARVFQRNPELKGAKRRPKLPSHMTEQG
jgi:hypothetical protein